MTQEQISTENGDTRTSEYGGEMHRTGHCDAAKRRRCPWASGPASRALLLVLELRPSPFHCPRGACWTGSFTEQAVWARLEPVPGSRTRPPVADP